VTVDFAVLIEGQNHKGSALNNPEAGMMRRVLLTPSLVFESSRSSATEPNTVGPKDGAQYELQDALGKSIGFRYSTELIRYLTRKQSTLLVPAISKRWDPKTYWWWDVNLSNLTWVERLMQASIDPKQYPPSFTSEVNVTDDKDKDKTKTVRVQPPPAPNVNDLPTAALAARSLGLTMNLVPVVVIENPQTGVVEVRERHTDRQSSMCSPSMKVPVPSVSFQAEFVSIRDGRLLARIDDVRAVKSPQFMQQSIVATEPTAVFVGRTGLTNMSASGTGGRRACVLVEDGTARCWVNNDEEPVGTDPNGMLQVRGRNFVAWKQATTSCDATGKSCAPIICQSIEDAVSKLIEDLAINGGPRVNKALAEIFSENLDVLYQN